MSKAGNFPADHTWPGFDALPEPLKLCHRRFFAEMAGRSPLTLQEYRRAFRALYEFMQVESIADLAALTPQRLEAFQRWCYRRHHWTPGNVENLLRRTLNRIGNSLQRLGLLADNPFAKAVLVQPQQQAAVQPFSWFRAARLYFRWLKARSVTSDVRRQYLLSLRRIFNFLGKEGPRLPHQTGPDDLKRFEVFLATHPTKSRRHAAAVLAPSMRRITLQHVRSFLRWLDREGFTQPEAKVSGPPGGSTDSPLEEEDGTVRLDTALREFLTYVRTRYAPDTQRQYALSIERFAEWTGTRPRGKRVRNVNHLTMEVLTDYVRWLNAEAVRPDASALSQPEKESRLYPLKAFLRFCWRKGFLPRDLRRFVLVPRREHQVRRRLLTEQEMARLLETPSESTTVGIRDRALLELSYSGLRAGELLKLKLEDVDLEENRLFLRETKGDKERVVPMTGAARYWIARWLSRRKEFLKGPDSGVVFLSQGRRPMSRRHFARNLEKFVGQAQLPVAVSPHDLRRITGTHLVANGAPIRLVQALLGHDSLKVTTKYLRLTDAQIKTEYDRTHPSSRRARHISPIA